MEQLIQALDLQSLATVTLPPVAGVEPMCAVAMPEERSFDRWQETDARARELGYVAFGIGSKEHLNGIQEHLECVESWDISDAIQVAKSFDLNAWFACREKELVEDAGELPIGTWQDPEDPPNGGLWFPFENGIHLNPWWMGIVPASEPWQIPLSLAYGNWNDCPNPIVHAAMCRHWHETSGANLVAVGADTVEFMVRKPPCTPEAALLLAKEQYLYCTDIVDQGIGSISALAASLIDNTTWNFWWD